ncbi:PREDICTED: uncharacterized aarF domain-containing protein kinase 2-like [Dufourea novaeangliae]|uniref:Putative aarF domain-containing protein kinase 2 n=1 Tax=Dufourea novaeangliae TaxID=178035 RepID=A0A154P392_DUFNO|nr:PREDICTED: uncharacterized aarF domain-containing protein kinase 2-like [Dufourea novaeangliae]KZC06409.1 putative aarF domain-containing protein kinase 2 [Dufourea novaeangliae]
MRHINLEGSKRIVKTVLILSYEPKRHSLIYENDSLIAEKDQENLFDVIQNAILIVARVFVIGSILTGVTVVYLITRLIHGHIFPTVLLKSIQFLGPIFIKFGQWASTRKDIFPEDICCTLSQLQRTVPPHSWFYTEQLLKSIYGPNWRKIFVKFENETPIGSGCCAQVYKAWIDLNARVEETQESRIPVFIQIIEYLKLGSLITSIDKMANDDSDNESQQDVTRNRKLQPVAVKILHPGIKGQLRRDLTIMRGVCKFATSVVPRLRWLSLTDCIDEFSQIMENQVDMNREAVNLLKFSENFSYKKDILFPRPYRNFTKRDILVESYHEGPSISEYLEYKDNKLQKKLAKLGIKMVLKMVFNDNFIHCDLHPGNILVETDRGSTEGTRAWLWRFIDRDYWPIYPRLIVLDCGLVVSLNDRCQQNLKDVFRSVLMGNGELAAEYILEHSSQVCPDPDGFKRTMREIVNTHLRKRDNVNVSTVVAELFSAMVRHKVKQDGSFSSVILSMAVIEGLGRSLNPNLDIFTEVLPFIFTNTLQDN